MNYPPGFPPHLRPQAYSVVLKAGRIFKKQGQGKKRVKRAIFELCEIICIAAEGGEWPAHSALEGMEDFLHILCVDDPDNHASAGSTTFMIWSEPIKDEVISSKKWLSYVERLAQIRTSAEASVDPGQASAPMTKDSIRRMLDEKGWSIGDWANKAGVSYHTVADYLNGKKVPYPSTRAKLASALGVPVNSLPEL
jgi:lambda repressor-like predicted transcriptional regulator